MTNKEWLSSLTAEEWYMKVHWLFNEYGKRYDNTYLAIIEWLKEEHEQKVLMPNDKPRNIFVASPRKRGVNGGNE